MRNRTLLALAAAAALGTPGLAAAEDGWSLTVGVWGGVSRYDVLGLKHGAGNVGSQDGKDLINGSFNTVGGSAVLRLGWLDLGALYEGTLFDKNATSEVITPLAGFKWDLSESVRLDVLGELGGHRIDSIGSGNQALTQAPKTTWLPYVGVRPSLSYRIPFGPTRLVLSATPFARWDLIKKDVTVQTSTGPTNQTTYQAGGSTFGLVGGVGIEL